MHRKSAGAGTSNTGTSVLFRVVAGMTAALTLHPLGDLQLVRNCSISPPLVGGAIAGPIRGYAATFLPALFLADFDLAFAGFLTALAVDFLGAALG